MQKKIGFNFRISLEIRQFLYSIKEDYGINGNAYITICIKDTPRYKKFKKVTNIKY